MFHYKFFARGNENDKCTPSEYKKCCFLSSFLDNYDESINSGNFKFICASMTFKRCFDNSSTQILNPEVDSFISRKKKFHIRNNSSTSTCMKWKMIFTITICTYFLFDKFIENEE